MSGTPTRIVVVAAMLAAIIVLALIAVQGGAGPAREAAPAPLQPTQLVAASSSVPAPQPVGARAGSADAGPVAVKGGALDQGVTGDVPMPRAPVAAEAPRIVVRVTHDLPIRSRPGGGAVVGTLPARSRYLGNEMWAWVRELSPNRRYGRVTIPWSDSDRSGWIRMHGLQRQTTRLIVRADLSSRTLRVYRSGRVIVRVPMAVGAPGSPSPTGHFWVTDPTPVPAGQPQFGSYAFGISALQPHPPRGWTGPRQMAIHGTNDPSSIGTAASAGCLRVSESALRQLRNLLRPGTPVEILR